MMLATDVQHSRRSTATASYDVVVVGAGPYGLSTAAHLRARGLHVAVFGKPMSLWREHMPAGMLLRSYWWATSLSDPSKRYSIGRYLLEIGQPPRDPLGAETIIDYGLWFQRGTVPDVDETYVDCVERAAGRFAVSLADGRMVESPVVVMAPGLRYYVYRPAELTHLSGEFVSHTSDHASFAQFAGKRVVVLGGGQSAVESAALLRESGAEVSVVARRPINWLTGASMANRTLKRRVLAPRAGIAPGWFNWGLEHLPYTFQRLPRATRDQLLRGRGSYGPAAAHWLRERILGKVRLVEMQTVEEAEETGDGLTLRLSNGETTVADHLVLGTGYRMDIRKLPMLHASLLDQTQVYQGAPVLSNQFESSVPGMFYVGFSSVSSCGPLFRFVVGTDAAARRVAQAAAWRTVRARQA